MIALYEVDKFHREEEEANSKVPEHIETIGTGGVNIMLANLSVVVDENLQIEAASYHRDRLLQTGSNESTPLGTPVRPRDKRSMSFLVNAGLVTGR